jgi:hypothetical protein
MLVADRDRVALVAPEDPDARLRGAGEVERDVPGQRPAPWAVEHHDAPSGGPLGLLPQVSHDLARRLLVPLRPFCSMQKFTNAEHQGTSSATGTTGPTMVDCRNRSMSGFDLRPAISRSPSSLKAVFNQDGSSGCTLSGFAMLGPPSIPRPVHGSSRVGGVRRGSTWTHGPPSAPQGLMMRRSKSP